MITRPHPKVLDVVLLIVALVILAGTAGPAHARDAVGQVAVVDSVIPATAVDFVPSNAG